MPMTTAGGTKQEPGTPRALRSFWQPAGKLFVTKGFSEGFSEALSAGWVLQQDGICAHPDAFLAALW